LGWLQIVVLECWLADLWVGRQHWVTWLCQIYFLCRWRQCFWHVWVSIDLKGRIWRNRRCFYSSCGCCLRWCLVVCWHWSTEWNIAVVPLGLLPRHQASEFAFSVSNLILKHSYFLSETLVSELVFMH
jgi:hypothetical protein